MAFELSQETLFDAAKWAYDKATGEIPGLGSAQALGEDYLNGNGSLESKIDSLIRWQCAKTFSSGFFAGLPGILAAPVTIPADLSSLFYIQLRMIAAIAHMTGHAVNDDKVRTLALLCLCGSSVGDVLKEVGVAVGKNMTKQLIKSISRSTITDINKAVGFRLLTKFGQTGVINLSKAIPFVGGVVGGSFNAVGTKSVGEAAKRVFHTA